MHAVGVHAPRYARKLVLTPPLAGPGFHHGSSAAGCLPAGGLSTMMWLAPLLAFSDRCALLCARIADPLTWALEEPEATSPTCWSSWSNAAAKHQPSLS